MHHISALIVGDAYRPQGLGRHKRGCQGKKAKSKTKQRKYGEPAESIPSQIEQTAVNSKTRNDKSKKTGFSTNRQSSRRQKTFPEFVVASIKDTRIHNGKTEYLVQWKGIRGNMWELADHIPDKVMLKSFIAKRQRDVRHSKRLQRDSARSRARSKSNPGSITVTQRSGRTLTKVERLASIFGDKSKPRAFYQYALDQKKGNLEQALLLLTSLKPV